MKGQQSLWITTYSTCLSGETSFTMYTFGGPNYSSAPLMSPGLKAPQLGQVLNLLSRRGQVGLGRATKGHLVGKEGARHMVLFLGIIPIPFLRNSGY